MLQFCTLFNTNYLSRGVAMYNSLEQHCKDFHLYIVAFDNNCLEVLNKLKLTKATIISLEDFENPALLAVKNERTAGEYCWTCASSSIKYCIETFSLDHCTYVDADLLFFSDPQVLINEMGINSVLITPHRYTPCYDQSATSGIYCVQFMTFKNTQEGMTVLNWWVDSCLDWCFNRFEDNKFGDQKYLDDWTERFTGVYVSTHSGGGIAPWNIQQFTFACKTGSTKVKHENDAEETDLVFYHYHGFSYCSNKRYRISPSSYLLQKKQISHVYKPYVKALSVAENAIANLQTDVVPHETNDEFEQIKRVIGRYIVFFFKGYYKNIYAKHFFQYGLFN